MLEALKLFLDVEGWVFVLALDPEAVESAIRRRYQGEVKARNTWRSLQVPFVLPPIEADPMRTYVQSLAPSLPDPRCAEVFAVGLDQPVPGQAHSQHLPAARGLWRDS